MKTLNLTNREMAQIKRIAQNVDANYQKVQKLLAKITELRAVADALQVEIDEMEAPVLRKTEGFRSTDIYMKLVSPQFNEDGTPKTDKDGRQIKVTKYVLRDLEEVMAEKLAETLKDEDNTEIEEVENSSN